MHCHNGHFALKPTTFHSGSLAHILSKSVSGSFSVAKGKVTHCFKAIGQLRFMITTFCFLKVAGAMCMV